ncbi:DNA segregation ATPase FtsK/SpoIIIE, S-DNA-T family [Actinomadura madurae]|uniref:DNA segregation ATPase FtsK/SpoIIIE, S-DNA-T family n=1 Tax=Actinomadura madurae TaxID=1993 RepID=A0A1I5S7J3_9ACTN|nr:FtsK/SpoIIIE domain-containing protein [Actinomadura madurae]SFP66661.1 DNA segregation ATPase FtsK/SpoIIIE, S-DNA-T family [Actinomadura madurae]
MSHARPMGEVVRLPVKHTDHTADPDTPALDAPTAGPDGTGVPPTDPPAPVPVPSGDRDGAEDDGEAIEGRVLVDRPDTFRPDVRARRTAGERAQRRPIIAPWLRDRSEAKATVRWAVGYAGHVTGYHTARIPLYSLRLAMRSPRGLWRVAAGTWRWTFDMDARPLRTHAIDRRNDEAYLKLMSERNDRVRARLMVTAAGAAGTGLAAMSVAAAGGVTQTAVLAALVFLLGWIGTPTDRRILDTAVVSTKAPKLTSEIVVRALAALGNAEINKAVGKGGSGITFPAPITRDGPGWRAEVDLPYGVTATDIMERRDRLASGLRRPLGCVWPEPAHDQHAGRLVLWVGDQDMNQVRPPVWPLAKTGAAADVFKPFPFGTDQRGRPVTLTLMYANMLIGAMPGAGKTFALKVPLLAAALDPTAQLRVFELKGTGDLDFAEKVAHHYGSGPDDTTIGECLASLREVYTDLEKRAKTLARLPKDVRPENKVTPQLAASTSHGLGPLVFVIDECQELFSHPEHGKEAGELATAIIKRGRALGVILLLATQRPDKASLPTGISANVGIRFCLRVMGQTENDMILGTSMYQNGIRATTFTKRDRGIGYLAGETDTPQIVRGYYLDGPTADRLADRARAARKAAGTLTGYAAGEDTTPAEGDGSSLLDDIAAVLLPGEDKVWSETVVTRLAELRPATYGAWNDLDPTGKAKHLAAALKPYGIGTGQIWGQGETGKGGNRRGITTAHILDALNERGDRAR